MKLSIIIPAYNVEKYINKCISSCLNQKESKSEYEIIIIDDGSTDDTYQILKKLENFNDNVHVFKQENRGASAARNNGLKSAVGEYVWFVDADDWIEENCLSDIFLNIQNSNLDLIYLNVNRVDDKHNIISETTTLPIYKEKSVTDGVTLFKSRTGDFIMPVRYIINRKFLIFNNLFFVEGMTFEDNEWAPRLLYYAKRVLFHSTPIYYYLQRSTSIMHQYNYSKIESRIKLLALLKDFRSTVSANKDFTNAFNEYIGEICSSYLRKRYINGARKNDDIRLFKKIQPLQKWDEMTFKQTIKFKLMKHIPLFYSLVLQKYKVG